MVVVEVADTGPGIGPDDLGHIWEELYRSPDARTVPGSGLGLALVRAVVERHGGPSTPRPGGPRHGHAGAVAGRRLTRGTARGPRREPGRRSAGGQKAADPAT